MPTVSDLNRAHKLYEQSEPRGVFYRSERYVNVRQTVSEDEHGRTVVVELAKTDVSRRQVPLSMRALEALNALPPRLDASRLFPAPKGGLLNLDHFRRREWAPAIEAARPEVRDRRIVDATCHARSSRTFRPA